MITRWMNVLKESRRTKKLGCRLELSGRFVTRMNVHSVVERAEGVVSPEDTTLEIVLLPFCRILYTCKLLFT